MKKIFIFLMALMACSVTYAGTYVLGVNQVDRLLKAIEKGTGDDVPTLPMTTDAGTGQPTINTDYDQWKNLPGLTFTANDFVPNYYKGTSADNGSNWYGITGIYYANKGYNQVAGTQIQLVQISTVSFDYSSTPDGYSDLNNYFDRNDLSWLETIDLSGNNLTDIVIDGGPYNTMPLKTVNLSNNPNLTSLSIVNCTQLEAVDLRGTGITPGAFETIKSDILTSSPDATILYNAPSGVKSVELNNPIVSVQGKNIVVKNKKANDIVQIFDMNGRKMIETSNDVINANSIAKGAYIMKINNFVKKICL
jgi:hypothetical protein